MMDGTIAAVATPPGEGGIAVIRVSGEKARDILSGCFVRASGEGMEPGRLCYGRVIGRDGAPIDEAMAVFLPAPCTYTREDVAEIQCHGGTVQARRVLGRVLELGARAAKPGEFTQRAFLGGRIDLSQAEAVMALVASGSEAAARAACRQLDGGVSATMRKLAGELIDQLALIGAGDDFPEEVEEQAAAVAVLERARRVREQLIALSDPRNARILREGLNVVLAGRPNTGKSSLLNALLGSDRAIVTEYAGTTRDLLSEALSVEGCRVTLIDTAGQRDADDPIERMGVERARGAQRDADLVLLVLDGSEPLTPEDDRLIEGADGRCVAVVNKCDLDERIDGARLADLKTLRVSARTSEGVPALRALIAREAACAAAAEDQLTVERHIDCAKGAIAAIERAIGAIDSGLPLDLAAVDLMSALDQLLAITGKNASEAVIDSVFANFCVGK